MTWRDRFDERFPFLRVMGRQNDIDSFCEDEVKSFIEDVVRERDVYWAKKIKKIIKDNTVRGYASFAGIASDVLELDAKLDDLKDKDS